MFYSPLHSGLVFLLLKNQCHNDSQKCEISLPLSSFAMLTADKDIFDQTTAWVLHPVPSKASYLGLLKCQHGLGYSEPSKVLFHQIWKQMGIAKIKNTFTQTGKIVNLLAPAVLNNKQLYSKYCTFLVLLTF